MQSLTSCLKRQIRWAFFLVCVLKSSYVLGGANDRVINIVPFVNNGTTFFLSIQNPSTVDQNISLVFTASGTYYFDDASSHTGGDSMDCPGSGSARQTCTLKTAYTTILKSKLLQVALKVKSTVSASSVPNDSGVKGVLTIQGNEGFLKAHILCDINAVGPVLIPVAGGHAF